MKAAYREADAIKIDGRRIVVDVERGRTVKDWLPRKLSGGLGKTRAGPDHLNKKYSGRDVGDSSESKSQQRSAPPPGPDRPPPRREYSSRDRPYERRGGYDRPPPSYSRRDSRDSRDYRDREHSSRDSHYDRSRSDRYGFTL